MSLRQYQLYESIRNTAGEELFLRVVNLSKQEYTNEKEIVQFATFTEIFQRLGIVPRKYSNFIDVCGAPGAVADYLLKKNLKITGFGVSLAPRERGFTFKNDLIKNKRYKFIYADIIKTNVRYKKTNGLSLISCFMGHNEDGDSDELFSALQQNALEIGIYSLKNGGDIVVTAGFRWKLHYLMYFVSVLHDNFEEVRIYKPTNFTEGIPVVYLSGIGRKYELDVHKYTGDLYPELLQLYKDQLEEVFRVMNLFYINNM
jgi:hypothetical protein